MINCPVGPVTYTSNTQSATTAELVWPLDLTCCNEDGLGERFDILAAAVDAMYEATCRRFGVCSITINPPGASNCLCPPPATDCGCPRRFDLRQYTTLPIISVDEIHVGGTLVPSTDYWISEGRWLIPLRDGAIWDTPAQDLNAAARSEGTWSIGLTIGRAPSPMVLLATADLACQIYKFCTNKACDLPPNAVSVIRDGTTIRLMTGLQSVPTVKMALEVHGNCGKRKRRTAMVHPADVGTHTTTRSPVAT